LSNFHEGTLRPTLRSGEVLDDDYGEHADFIAHLLDPEERALITKAMQTSDTFRQMPMNQPLRASQLGPT